MCFWNLVNQVCTFAFVMRKILSEILMRIIFIEVCLWSYFLQVLHMEKARKVLQNRD